MEFFCNLGSFLNILCRGFAWYNSNQITKNKKSIDSKLKVECVNANNARHMLYKFQFSLLNIV